MAVQSDKLRLLRRIPQIRFEEELRGYSKSQVDRVLENLAPLADEIEVLQQRLAEAEQRVATAAQGGAAVAPVPAPSPKPPEDFDEQLREVMLMAQRTAKDRVETAEADAEQIRAESKANADSLMASARNEAKELKGEAHAQREQMLADAEEERAQMLETARTETDERRRAVEAELVESEGALRDDLLEEIKDMRGKREEIAGDLSRFEDHLASRRAAVQAALTEIGEAIDDPERLRENELLEAVEVAEIDEDGLSEISVHSDALEELAGEAEAARVAIDGPVMDAEPEFEPQVPEYDEALMAAPVDEIEPIAEWTPPLFEEPQPLDQPPLGDASASPPLEPSFEADADAGDGAGAEFPAAEAYQAPAEAFDYTQSDAGRPGFFDSAPPSAGEDRGWDAPPAMPEPVVEEPPEEAPSRGGRLSGLLGGRRSNDPAPPPPSNPTSALPEDGGYLPPPTGDITPEPDTSGEGMLGLRRRMAGAPHEADFDPGSPTTEASLAEAAMNAVTEAPPPMPADSGFGAAPQDFASEPDFADSSSPIGASPFDQPAPSEDSSRPAWADAIPEDVGSLGPDDLGGGTSDQYLEELRRVTGDDADTDENDEALERFLNDPEDQGGGWFGRRK